MAKIAETRKEVVVGEGKYMDAYVSIEGSTIYTRTHILNHVKLAGFTGGMKAYFSDVNGQIIYETPLFQYGVDGEYIPFKSHERTVEEHITLPSSDIYNKTDRISIWIGMAGKNRFWTDVLIVVNVVKTIYDLYQKYIADEGGTTTTTQGDYSGEYTAGDGIMAFTSGLNTTAAREPGPYQIALYEHINYGGASKVLNVGNYSNPAQMGFPNDTLSSIKVGSRVRATLFEHDKFQGRNQQVLASMPSLVGSFIGNDAVSSIKVSPEPGPTQVILFQDVNYEGAYKILEIGSYASTAQMGFSNDALSSIKIGSRVRVTLYEHNNFQGRNQLISANVPSLVGSYIGNDTVSSMIIRTF